MKRRWRSCGVSRLVELANDELSSAIRDAVRENWAAIRTHVVRGPVQTRFNQRLATTDMRELHEPLLFDQQTTGTSLSKNESPHMLR